MRVARGANLVFAVVDKNAARLQRAVADDAFDQCALAGAVLAEQGVNGAGADLEGHLVECAKRTEMLAGTNRLKARGAHVHAPNRSRSIEEWPTAPNTPPCIFDHAQGRRMVARVGRPAAVFQQQALEATVIGFAQGGVHADVGGDAGQDQIVDAAGAQDQFRVGGAEGAFAGLVEHDFSGQRCQLVDDFPARLATYQNLAARTWVADSRADALRAPAFVGGQVTEVRAMAFAGMDDGEAQRAHRGEQRLDRLDGRTGQCQVVTHAVHVAADAAEIGLHVDHDQGCVVRMQLTVPGPG